MTDMTSEQYRELADLCGETEDNLERIARAYDDSDPADLTGKGELYAACLYFRDKAQHAEKIEASERQLHEDVVAIIDDIDEFPRADLITAADAIIRRVREADKG